MAVIVRGTGDSGLPQGWVVQSDTDVESGRRRIIASGPYASVVEAREALLAQHDQVSKPAVTHEPGSPSATIEFYVKGTAWSQGDSTDELEPILPDRWELVPMSEQVALESMPKFVDSMANINVARDRLLRGDISGAAAAVDGDAVAQRWLALYMAGVRTWQAVTYSYRYIRTYAFSDAGKVKSATQDLAQAIGVVYDWANVEGSGDCPSAEPKWLDANGEAQPFEWRLDGVAVSATEDGEIVLTYSFQAAWKWASDLYQGGSWSPPAVTA